MIQATGGGGRGRWPQYTTNFGLQVNGPITGGAYKQQFMVLDCTLTSDITSVSGNFDVQCDSEWKKDKVIPHLHLNQ